MSLSSTSGTWNELAGPGGPLPEPCSLQRPCSEDHVRRFFLKILLFRYYPNVVSSPLCGLAWNRNAVTAGVYPIQGVRPDGLSWISMLNWKMGPVKMSIRIGFTFFTHLLCAL